MSRLFSYTIPLDDGAAPNPFNGMCSLAICKPSIRRVAKVGDWIAGLGSRNAPGGDRRGQLIYAMRIDEVVSMEDYDRLAPSRWPYRIPDVDSPRMEERLGDCIYNYSSGHPVQRRGVHDEGNRETDLSGRNVLLSRDFYYFGNNAVPLPEHLRDLCHQTQGHKSDANSALLQPFEEWLRGQGWVPAYLYGQPDAQVNGPASGASCRGCEARRIEAEKEAVSTSDI